ncbi:unnamed protein product [Microthlaspi erraticum]|uniref:Uncharacterized protein n=1 Tax=Microthlaspi erraticum TaxID=1685480 RepID=A0A6D2L0K4_9BRAS|nr:unnamed protein product [Microthlaspi erraticum]
MDGLLLSHSPEHQNPTTDPALENRELKAKKKEILNNDGASTSSSSSSTSNTNSTRRVSHRLRKPTVRLGMARRSVVERQAEALALGMSTATFASLVFEKKSVPGQKTNRADLALIYASAVKECLANVYGHKLGSFAERSFNSTLGILKVINDPAFPHQLDTLEKSKLEVDVSRAGTRAERLKTELEDKLKAMLGRIYFDWLVLSVINTLVWTSYGAYVFSTVFSQESVMERFINLIFRPQVWLQMNFPVLMILVVTYLIIRRSSATKQRMSSIFYLLFLPMVCGLSGKLFVDKVGGNGELWLSLWGRLCLFQYAAVRFITWAVFGLLTQGTKPKTMVMLLRWAHRSIFIGLVLALPLINGLLPFATYSEWRHLFSIGMDAIRGGLGL